MITGTCVYIETELNIDNPDSVKIDIYDPSNTKRVTQANMSSLGNKKYYYLFQSSVSYGIGQYKALMEAKSGAYTGVSKQLFALEAA